MEPEHTTTTMAGESSSGEGGVPLAGSGTAESSSLSNQKMPGSTASMIIPDSMAQQQQQQLHPSVMGTSVVHQNVFLGTSTTCCFTALHRECTCHQIWRRIQKRKLARDACAFINANLSCFFGFANSIFHLISPWIPSVSRWFWFDRYVLKYMPMVGNGIVVSGRGGGLYRNTQDDGLRSLHYSRLRRRKFVWTFEQWCWRSFRIVSLNVGWYLVHAMYLVFGAPTNKQVLPPSMETNSFMRLSWTTFVHSLI